MKQSEIKVSPVEKCKIEYNKSVSELRNYYSEQAERIKKGDKKCLSGELMQLGFALDFIDLVNDAFHIFLDFDEESVSRLENVLEKICLGFYDKKIPQESFEDILKGATGYFSVLVWKNVGGGFINSSLGYGINLNRTDVFVYNRIGRRLQGDKSANVELFYQSLKSL
ncbi:MAG: hypothetical protein J6X97_04455 [Lachnospiraceae bacterium]|nr:hypothetical protein [Lachnospiraceae bacterium]